MGGALLLRVLLRPPHLNRTRQRTNEDETPHQTVQMRTRPGSCVVQRRTRETPPRSPPRAPPAPDATPGEPVQTRTRHRTNEDTTRVVYIYIHIYNIHIHIEGFWRHQSLLAREVGQLGEQVAPRVPPRHLIAVEDRTKEDATPDQTVQRRTRHSTNEDTTRVVGGAKEDTGVEGHQSLLAREVGELGEQVAPRVPPRHLR